MILIKLQFSIGRVGAFLFFFYVSLRLPKSYELSAMSHELSLLLFSSPYFVRINLVVHFGKSMIKFKGLSVDSNPLILFERVPCIEYKGPVSC